MDKKLKCLNDYNIPRNLYIMYPMRHLAKSLADPYAPLQPEDILIPVR